MFSRSKDEIHSEATKATICEAKRVVKASIARRAKGALCHVLWASDTRSGHTQAVKILRPQRLRWKGYRTEPRILRECGNAILLRHVSKKNRRDRSAGHGRQKIAFTSKRGCSQGSTTKRLWRPIRMPGLATLP